MNQVADVQIDVLCNLAPQLRESESILTSAESRSQGDGWAKDNKDGDGRRNGEDGNRCNISRLDLNH